MIKKFVKKMRILLLLASYISLAAFTNGLLADETESVESNDPLLIVREILEPTHSQPLPTEEVSILRLLLERLTQGRILIDGKSVDLASGEIKVAVTGFRDKEDPIVTESNNGSEFIQLAQRCERVSGTIGQTRDCLIFKDAQGVEFSRYKLNWRFQDRPPRLSPDGQLIGLIDLDNTELVIIDRAGNIIDHSRQHVRDVAWAQDGTLVYSSRQSIYRVAPSQIKNAAADTLIQSFKPELGFPGRLSVSPKDRRIAFALVTNSNWHSVTSTVWIMNFDGSNPVLFAHSKPGFSNGINKPLWSPDGQWILVRQKPYEAPGAAGPRKSGTLTILNSDVANHELGIESELQINLEAVCFRKPGCDNPKKYPLPPREVASWITGGWTKSLSRRKRPRPPDSN